VGLAAATSSLGWGAETQAESSNTENIVKVNFVLRIVCTPSKGRRCMTLESAEEGFINPRSIFAISVMRLFFIITDLPFVIAVC
jgi:hypothetical protein